MIKISIIFALFVSLSSPSQANLFYCADFSCQEPISIGKTSLLYTGKTEKHLSFPRNVDIQILSKPVSGGDDWIGFYGGKIGLVPKSMIREMKMIKYDTKFQFPFEELPLWGENPGIKETTDENNYVDSPEAVKVVTATVPILEISPAASYDQNAAKTDIVKESPTSGNNVSPPAEKSASETQPVDSKIAPEVQQAVEKVPTNSLNENFSAEAEKSIENEALSSENAVSNTDNGALQAKNEILKAESEIPKQQEKVVPAEMKSNDENTAGESSSNDNPSEGLFPVHGGAVDQELPEPKEKSDESKDPETVPENFGSTTATSIFDTVKDYTSSVLNTILPEDHQIEQDSESMKGEYNDFPEPTPTPPFQESDSVATPADNVASLVDEAGPAVPESLQPLVPEEQSKLDISESSAFGEALEPKIQKGEIIEPVQEELKIEEVSQTLKNSAEADDSVIKLAEQLIMEEEIPVGGSSPKEILADLTKQSTPESAEPQKIVETQQEVQSTTEKFEVNDEVPHENSDQESHQTLGAPSVELTPELAPIADVHPVTEYAAGSSTVIPEKSFPLEVAVPDVEHDGESPEVPEKTQAPVAESVDQLADDSLVDNPVEKHVVENQIEKAEDSVSDTENQAEEMKKVETVVNVISEDKEQTSNSIHGEEHDHDHRHDHRHSHDQDHHHGHSHSHERFTTDSSSSWSVVVVMKHLSGTLLNLLPEHLQDTILDVDSALVFTGIIALMLVSICVPYFLMESILSVRPLKKQVVELNKSLWKVSAAYENQQEEFDTYKKKALAYDEDQKRIEQLEIELSILKKLEGKQKEQVKLLQKQLKTSAKAADKIEDLIDASIRDKEVALEERNLLKTNYSKLQSTLKSKLEELEEVQTFGSALALDLEIVQHERENLSKRLNGLESELELTKLKLFTETENRRTKETENENLVKEKDVMSTELTDLRKILHQYEEKVSEMTEELTVKENELLALKEDLGEDSPLIDISEVKAKLMSAEKEAATMKARVESISFENSSVSRSLEEVKAKLVSVQTKKEEAENNLKVLEGWFQKKEEELRAAVAKLEVEQSVKHKNKDDLIKMIREKESEVQLLISTNDGLKQEIEDMKGAHRSEIRTAEAKADEHWLSLCQSERKTAEARKECEQLRQKLVSIVKEKDGDDNDLLDGLDLPLYSLPLDFVPPPVPDDSSYFPLDADFIPPAPLPLGPEPLRPPPLGRLSPTSPHNNYYLHDPLSPIVRGSNGGRGDYSDESSRSDSPDHRRPGSRDNWMNDNRSDIVSQSSNRRRRGAPRQSNGPKTSSPIPHGVNL